MRCGEQMGVYLQDKTMPLSMVSVDNLGMPPLDNTDSAVLPEDEVWLLPPQLLPLP